MMSRVTKVVPICKTAEKPGGKSTRPTSAFAADENLSPFSEV